MKTRARRAFTLMEVLLAIALIAMASGFVAMSVSLFSEDALKSRPPERVFISALKRAQLESAERGKNVCFTYDKEGFFLILDSSDKSVIAKIWLDDDLKVNAALAAQSGSKPDNAPTEIKFIPKYPDVIGTASIDFPEGEISEITLAPDGSMTPVKVVFSHEGEEPATLDIDPFCAAPADDDK